MIIFFSQTKIVLFYYTLFANVLAKAARKSSWEFATFRQSVAVCLLSPHESSHLCINVEIVKILSSSLKFAKFDIISTAR
jgi:hypothetical protein